MYIEFWTSTEYSGFLQDLVEEIGLDHGEEAWEVRQRFLISEEAYRGASGRWERFCLRGRQYVLYPLYLLGSLGWRRLKGTAPDVAVVTTNTFYAPYLATWVHPRVVHLVYDLFPEALAPEAQEAQVKEEGIKDKRELMLHRLIRRIVASTWKRAAVNVFLGERLRGYVESVYGPVDNGVVIPVGACAFGGEEGIREKGEGRRDKGEGRIEDPPPGAVKSCGQAFNLEHPTLKEVAETKVSPPSSNFQLPSSGHAVTVLYCGNLGRMHEFKTLEGFWRGQNTEVRGPVKEVRWRFHCSGPKKPELEAAVAGLPEGLRTTIQVQGGLGGEEWRKVMLSADVALVTMVPGAERVVMPSKTYSAMMAGQALLAIAPEDSDLVDLIKQADCGWWVEPSDDGGLAEVLDRLKLNPDEVRQKQGKARHYAEAHFCPQVLAAKWREVLGERP